jgi:hypothetical protein
MIGAKSSQGVDTPTNTIGCFKDTDIFGRILSCFNKTHGRVQATSSSTDDSQTACWIRIRACGKRWKWFLDDTNETSKG